jgi:hypothetical protein
MSKFTEAQLRAYIEKISDDHGLGITISDAPIRLEDRHFNFKGRIKGTRGEKVIAVPFESFQYGVITARSVLYGTHEREIAWLVNGQACGRRTGEAACFVGRTLPVSLHISKAQLKEWTHENLERAPEDKKATWLKHFDQNYEGLLEKGLYADEASFGCYVDNGGDYLNLQLEPISVAANEPEPEAVSTLKM